MLKNINVKVKEEKFNILVEEAKKQEVSLSHVVRVAINEYLDKQK